MALPSRTIPVAPRRRRQVVGQGSVSAISNEAPKGSGKLDFSKPDNSILNTTI